MLTNVLFFDAKAKERIQWLINVADPILPKVGDHYISEHGHKFTVRGITYGYTQEPNGWVAAITVFCEASYVNTDPARV